MKKPTETNEIVWTPEKLRAARKKLGLSAAGLAHIVNSEGPTVRKWEGVGTATATKPNPQACRIVEWLLDGFRPKQWDEAMAMSARVGRPKREKP